MLKVAHLFTGNCITVQLLTEVAKLMREPHIMPFINLIKYNMINAKDLYL